jgi:hypothetical protein
MSAVIGLPTHKLRTRHGYFHQKSLLKMELIFFVTGLSWVEIGQKVNSTESGEYCNGVNLGYSGGN